MALNLQVDDSELSGDEDSIEDEPISEFPFMITPILDVEEPITDVQTKGERKRLARHFFEDLRYLKLHGYTEDDYE